MNLTSDDIKIPCISYMEISNIPITAQNNPLCTLGYSRVNMQVKVWGTNLQTIQEYAKQIDNKLRPLGWKRTSTTELHDNQSSMIQKILGYEAVAVEEF